MAHVLTEVAGFDANITVPDGTDSRVDAAEVVAAIAQKLANRSQYLKALADGAAQIAGDNTFTGNNAFLGSTLTGALQVNGTLDVNGNTVLGADGSGDLTVNGVITANPGGSILSYGAITSAAAVSGATVSASGDIETSTGNIKLGPTNRVNYTGTASQRTRKLNIPIEYAKLGSNATWQNGSLTLNTTNGDAWLPVPKLPNGAEIVGFDVIGYSATGATLFGSIDVHAKLYGGTEGGPDSTYSPGGTQGLHAWTAVAYEVMSFTLSGYVVSNQKDTYILHLATDTAINVMGARVLFVDPGLRSE